VTENGVLQLEEAERACHAIVFDRDEPIRADTTAEGLAALKPAFKEGGTVTAGNAPGVNDGSAALVVMDSERAKSLGLTPLGSIVGQATSGLAPKFVLMTPVDAVRRVGLLARENTPVRLEFNALGVRLTSSSPDLGNAVEAVEARYEGEDITVAFNPGYLADGLQASTGDTIKLEVRDGLKPGVVRGDTEEFTYLVMPVRLPAPVG
jgi:hypothetical protein